MVASWLECCNARMARTACLTVAVLLLSGWIPAIADVQNLYKINESTFDAHVRYQQTYLKPGEELVLGDLSGPGKITYFYFTDSNHFNNSEPSATYPGLVFKVYWDNAPEPSVQLPLWSFFGSFARKTIDYESLPMQINHYCYMSHLPMPFSKRARLTLVNDGDVTYSGLMAWGVDYERSNSFENEKSRLHATWTRSNPTRDSMHILLNIQGRGQYVGNFLQVSTNYQGWWGEGDTIFEVDGKEITHSPGTEDEYGSTWGFERMFSHLYTGYIQMDEQHRMYRWYVSNPVRFQKSLRVRIQNQRLQTSTSQAGQAPEPLKNGQVPSHGQVGSKDDYTSVAFWYQEGAHPAPALPSYRERTEPSKVAAYTSKR